MARKVKRYAGNSLIAAMASFFHSNLLGIFILFAVLGYVIMTVTKLVKNFLGLE